MNIRIFRLQSFVKYKILPIRMNATAQTVSMQSTIEEKLRNNFQPTHLEVVNESFKHNVPKGSESHFKVVVVSDLFENVSLLQRHRMVNKLLSEELSASIHALSIQAVTPAQWSSATAIHTTPNCMGGDKGKGNA